MDSDTAVVSAGDANLVKGPSENARSVKITALNDDCLLAIFSRLSEDDLGAMKQSHPRFAYAANECFKKKHGLDKGRFYNFPGLCPGLDNAANLVHNFGDVITRVTFLANPYARTIQEKQAYFSLLKDCSAIETLVIIDRINDLWIVDPMELRIFEKLKVLCLSKSSGTDADFIRILNACDPLKIQVIQLEQCKGLSDNVLNLIAERLISIKSIRIHFDICTDLILRNVSNLVNLPQLTHFDFTCKQIMVIAPILNALASITTLKTVRVTDQSDGTPDENTVDAISNLSSLKQLSFKQRKIPDQLMERITTYKRIEIDTNEFSDVCTYTFEN